MFMSLDPSLKGFYKIDKYWTNRYKKCKFGNNSYKKYDWVLDIGKELLTIMNVL